MKITRIKSGGEFEEKIGYCRAVVANGFVFVAGTCAEGADAPAQAKTALQTIQGALEKAGSDLSKAVRVTYYLPNISDFESCWPVLREAFGDNPPAATVIESKLINPKFKIEIEVTAVA